MLLLIECGDWTYLAVGFHKQDVKLEQLHGRKVNILLRTLK